MVVLGICTSHDAGITIIKDGKILGAVNEERFTRKKLISGIPKNSLKNIWKYVSVKPEDIDIVAVATRILNGDPPINNDLSSDNKKAQLMLYIAEIIDRLPLGIGKKLLNNNFFITIYKNIMPFFSYKYKHSIKKYLRNMNIKAPIKFYDHHDSHMASAYFTSGWNKALLISNDGFGDGICSKVGIGNNGSIKIIKQNSFYNSIGMYYQYATLLCGFKKTYHAGKTTGLAAFGNPEKTIKFFQKWIKWDEKKGIYINKGKLFRNALKEIKKALHTFKREDIAAGIQKHVSDIIVKMVHYYINKYKIPYVALAGGLHANVRINQAIAEIPNIKGVFIHPNMGDGGLSLGAGYLAYSQFSKEKAKPIKLKHVYLGPYFTEEEIKSTLEKNNISYKKPKNIEKMAAIYLKKKKIIARFDGAMEYGPRALGNRSILYDASDPSVNKWLNKQLKRTEFMPFAPVIRDKDAKKYLKNYTSVTKYASKFMTITYNVTEICKNEAPAIVHIDGTARPQIINKKNMPSYYKILEEYYKLTGKGILVNTSFNMHEEPIVCSPDDAIKAFYKSNLDILIIGPFLVENKKYSNKNK